MSPCMFPSPSVNAVIRRLVYQNKELTAGGAYFQSGAIKLSQWKKGETSGCNQKSTCQTSSGENTVEKKCDEN